MTLLKLIFKILKVSPAPLRLYYNILYFYLYIFCLCF
nr:MAG TPA: hypothetical protein [Caudoviricetes sp.]